MVYTFFLVLITLLILLGEHLDCGSKRPIPVNVAHCGEPQCVVIQKYRVTHSSSQPKSQKRMRPVLVGVARGVARVSIAGVSVTLC